MSEKKMLRRYGPYVVEITHSDKVLFPEDGITKYDVIDYYDHIAPMMIPYMKDRPLTMHRFPNGIRGQAFYQKDIGEYFPHWIQRIAIPKLSGGITTYVICNNRATLVYIANQACITPHIWLSKRDKLNYPDRMIFDLDPADSDFKQVVFAALAIKDLLDKLGLVAFPMTTGSRGMHLVIPLDRKADFDTVRDFAHTVGYVLAQRYPDQLTTEIRKDKRGNRLFIDAQRNSFGATAVTPYAIRARPGAPVATPLHWQEVTDPHLRSQSYTIATIFKRLERVDNVWKNMSRSIASLDRPRKLLQDFIND